MKTTMERAAGYQRKALNDLYNRYKEEVFFFAQKLLPNLREAESAVLWAYESLWSGTNPAGIETEDIFRREVYRKVASWARKRMTQYDPKAFRIPKDKNFALPAEIAKREKGETAEDYAMRLLPVMQRFILVLKANGFTYGQMMVLFKLDTKTLELAVTAAEKNLSRLMSSGGWTVEVFMMGLTGQSPVSEGLQKEMQQMIDKLASPVEKKEKEKRIFVFLTSALLIAATLGITLWVNSSIQKVIAEEDAALSYDTVSDDELIDELEAINETEENAD